MLSPGGYALILTTFLLVSIRLRPIVPLDETGLKQLLLECGFARRMSNRFLGNRSWRHIRSQTDGSGLTTVGWRSLKNDPLFPVAVWL